MLEYKKRGSEAYDLCIDNNKQIVQLTSQKWPSIVAGTRIVMRIIKYEYDTGKNILGHKCPGCNTWYPEEVGKSSITWYLLFSHHKGFTNYGIVLNVILNLELLRRAHGKSQ